MTRLGRRKVEKVSGDIPHRPYMTPEGRENDVVAMAYDLAEKQIREGTASSQVITHFLKLGTAKERLEREILAEQKKLIVAKTETLESEKKDKVAYEEVLAAMKKYRGDEE